MNDCAFTLRSNTLIAKDTYKAVLDGDTSEIKLPGQFVNIKLDGFFLRRPISVCDTENGLTLVYKTVGDGSEALSRLKPGAVLMLLTGLGNGYDTSKSGDSPLLVGGGVGTPPLYLLCKKLLSEGKHPRVILGFNTAAEAILTEEFKALGVPVTVTTADGSLGIRGFVTDALNDSAYSYFFACGPLPMFKAMEKTVTTSGQYSFEERMGCGFGACMGCTHKTKGKYKRICKDGPVLEREEIIWE